MVLVSDFFLPISTFVFRPTSALLAFVVADGDGLGYVSDDHLLHHPPVKVVLFP